jgi:lipid A disaccharide synthetase
MLVPELIQQDATVEKLSSAVITALDINAREQLEAEFDQLHNQINRDSGNCAALAIAELVGFPAIDSTAPVKQ